MTEEIAATPGWVDQQLDDIFRPLASHPGVAEARGAYAACIASRKAPAAPSDLLGAEFEGCSAALTLALHAARAPAAACDAIAAAIEELEARIAGET